MVCGESRSIPAPRKFSRITATTARRGFCQLEEFADHRCSSDPEPEGCPDLAGARGDRQSVSSSSPQNKVGGILEGSSGAGGGGEGDKER